MLSISHAFCLGRQGAVAPGFQLASSGGEGGGAAGQDAGGAASVGNRVRWGWFLWVGGWTET